MISYPLVNQCGGDLVPWGVWRRPGTMGCVEETWCVVVPTRIHPGAAGNTV